MSHGRSSQAQDGGKIRRLRELAGMNLRQLAQACKEAGYSISDSQLSKIEREICRPRVGLYPALSAVFSVAPEDLVRTPAGGNR